MLYEMTPWVALCSFMLLSWVWTNSGGVKTGLYRADIVEGKGVKSFEPPPPRAQIDSKIRYFHPQCIVEMMHPLEIGIYSHRTVCVGLIQERVINNVAHWCVFWQQWSSVAQSSIRLQQRSQYLLLVWLLCWFSYFHSALSHISHALIFFNVFFLFPRLLLFCPATSAKSVYHFRLLWLSLMFWEILWMAMLLTQSQEGTLLTCHPQLQWHQHSSRWCCCAVILWNTGPHAATFSYISLNYFFVKRGKKIRENCGYEQK